jgi:hypothetical protein
VQRSIKNGIITKLMKMLIQSEKYVLKSYYAKLSLETIFSRAILIGSNVLIALIGDKIRTENKTKSIKREILLKYAYFLFF